PHGPRHGLPAKTMPQHRYAVVDAGAYEGKRLRDPRQAVVRAHRPAHEDEAAEVARVTGDGLALVDSHQAPWHVAAREVCGKIPGTFGRHVAEYGDGLHAL